MFLYYTANINETILLNSVFADNIDLVCIKKRGAKFIDLIKNFSSSELKYLFKWKNMIKESLKPGKT